MKIEKWYVIFSYPFTGETHEAMEVECRDDALAYCEERDWEADGLILSVRKEVTEVDYV